MIKSDLRKRVRQNLATLSEEHIQSKSRSIVENLIQWLRQNPSSHKLVIGGFYPLNDEPQWLSLTQQFEADWCWPVFEAEQQAMTFAQCLQKDLVTQSFFGRDFKQPPKEALNKVPDLLLIPGLAFTKEGHRLGRGKGYYDRYLENFSGTKIGICFEESILELIPVDPHDVVMNYVVSDLGIKRVNGLS